MIDWNLFRSTLEPYPQEVILEVINTFITNYPEDRRQLQEAIASRDYPGIERHAHDVKTNCLWVGATEAANLALQFEMMGKKKEEDRFEALFPLLDQAVGEVLSELAEYRRNK